MDSKYKTNIGLLILLFVVALIQIIINPPLVHPLSSEPVIIFIGDMRPDSFGSNVKIGIDKALKKYDDNNFEIITLDFDESVFNSPSISTDILQIENRIKTLQLKLVRILGEENVIGIISANSSSSIEPVLEVADTFHIPTLITVATNDQILPRNHKLAFRLVPKDNLQANEIAEWVIKSSTEDSTEVPLAIIHDPQQYGANLQNMISSEIGYTSVLTFPLSSNSNMTEIVNNGNLLGANNWVFIGYKEQAMSFYARQRYVESQNSILFSDGAFGNWLYEINKESIYISFPTTELFDPVNNDSLSGYSSFGYDATRIFQLAISDGISKSKSKLDLVDLIRTSSKKSGLIHKYQFNEQGENELAEFKLINIKLSDYQ